MIVYNQLILTIALLLQFSLAPCAWGRPKFLQEQTSSYHWNFLKGVYVGLEDVASFMGYYQDEEVAQSLDDETLIINEEDEEDQTTMQLACLGLGRTGSTSLVIALEMLGYTVVHDDEQVELADLYAAMDRGDINGDDFHRILGLRGFNATAKSGSPGWVVRNPESKAIVTVRDSPEAYAQSWIAAAPFISILQRRPFCWMSIVQELFPELFFEYKWENTRGHPDDFLDLDILKKSYVEHNEELQATIPQDRLLIFNVKEGWGPLCEFLGKPIPEGVPFPHVHTRAKLDGEMKLLELVTYIWPLAFLIPLWILTVILKRVFPKERHPVISQGMVLASALLFLYLLALETELEHDEEFDDDD